MSIALDELARLLDSTAPLSPQVPLEGYRKAFRDLPLEPDWDTYGALPITEDAKEAAMEFIAQVLAGRLDIVPTCRGGVALQVTHGDEELDIEIDSDGTQYIED